MTLYLTSDETNTDGENSRTNFKNRISADYFESQPFNLKLQEIFFDSKFPTLADIEFPHIITTIIGKEHKLEDFPSKFQSNFNFQFLFKNYKDTEKSPLLVEKQAIYDSHCSSSDCEVFYEIHPRLHFAFSIAFINLLMLKFLQCTLLEKKMMEWLILTLGFVMKDWELQQDVAEQQRD